MTHNKSTVRKLQKESADEHTLLQQEDFRWLSELHDVLSPYWSARLEYREGDRHPLLAIDGFQKNDRN
jgi:hypothetical protein